MRRGGGLELQRRETGETGLRSLVFVTVGLSQQELKPLRDLRLFNSILYEWRCSSHVEGVSVSGVCALWMFKPHFHA